MTKISNLIFLFCLILLSSCDNDDKFEMVTKRSYLLAKDSTTNTHKIIKIENEKMSEWAISLNNNGEIGDMCGKDNHFWVSDVKNNEIMQFNAFDESKTKTFYSKVIPHYICVGETHLIVCDTISQKIDYINLKNSDIQTFTLSEKPSIPVAANHKFYIKEGEKNMGIYEETNFGKRENLPFNYPIQDIQVDVNLSAAVWVQTSYKDTTYQSSISLLWDNYNFPDKFRESKPNPLYTKKRYSPYSNKAFGKEFLQPVYLFNGKFSLLSADKKVSDFEMNFFESQFFFLKSSKLYQYNVAQKQLLELGAFSGSFLKSYFYLDFKESVKIK